MPKLKILNRLICLTLIFSFIIFTVRGHGIAPLGIVGLVGFSSLLKGYFSFNFSGEDRILTAGVIAVFGYLLLTIALFISLSKLKLIFIYTGLSILISAFILFIRYNNSEVNHISIITGIPFLIASIFLLIEAIRNHKKISPAPTRSDEILN